MSEVGIKDDEIAVEQANALDEIIDISTILPIVILLSACSTSYIPVTDQSTNYDFSTITTYNIVGDKELKNPLISDIDRVRIDKGINTTLQSRGKVQTTQSKAGVLISYFIVTKDKVKFNSMYTGGYYGNSGCYRCASNIGVTHISTRDYVEGTIVVDIIDNSSKQSIWRSTLVKPLKEYETSKERDLAIQQSVEVMFKNLPLS